MLAWIVSLVMVGTPLPFSELIIDPKETWLDALVECESGGNADVAVIDSNGYWSRGLFQFQLSTWLSYGKKFGATRENVFNPILQRKVAKSMLDNGGQRHWANCAEQIFSSLGDYPAP